MQYKNIRLQKLQDKVLIPLIENINRGGKNSVLVDNYIKSNDNKKTLYIDSNELYGLSMVQSLLLVKLKLRKLLTYKFF